MAGYEVTPKALDDAATAFQQESAQIKNAVDSFLAAARLPDTAFGNLPDSYKLINEYAAFLQRAEADLATLHGSLDATNVRLGETAVNYRKAEASNRSRRHRT